MRQLNIRSWLESMGKAPLLPIAIVIAGGIVGTAFASIFIPSAPNDAEQVAMQEQASTVVESDQIVLSEVPVKAEEAEITVAAYAVPNVDTLQEMTKTVSVAKGDTLMKVLTRAGADRNESHQAISALTEVFNPRNLRIGQNVTLHFEASEKVQPNAANTPSLTRVSLNEDVDRQLAAVRTPGAGFTAQ